MLFSAPRPKNSGRSEFFKDGTFRIRTTPEINKGRVEGTYTVRGSTLEMTLKVDGLELTGEVTILRLTDGVLETEDPRGMKEVMRRTPQDK